MPKAEKRAVEVARIPIVRHPEGVMFLQTHGADAELPDGRKVLVGSTCGCGGVDLLVHVDGRYYGVDARAMLTALIEAGAFDEAPTRPAKARATRATPDTCRHGVERDAPCTDCTAEAIYEDSREQTEEE